MKIASYNIAMASQHTLLQRDEKSESLRMWNNNQAGNGQPKSPLAQMVDEIKRDMVDISSASRRKLQLQLRQAQTTATGATNEDTLYQLSDADKQKIQLIQDFIEALTGKKVKFVLPKGIKIHNPDLKQAQTATAAQQAQAPQLQGWGIAYDYHEQHLEQEQTTFNAAGVVKTADGKEIDFSLAVSMSRQFMSEQNISIRAGDATIDPLVVNFAGPAASLTQNKFSFDLDSDGSAENISFVGPGSGFLTLDLNNDGKVNDGSELFGPKSGDGFADLAAYDSDGNNWIDENDAIYDKLRIWTKDENGQDQLFALGQKGIGAIYLGNVSTEFAYKDSANVSQGQLRTSSVFLREDGSAGTIQQVDLAV